MVIHTIRPIRELKIQSLNAIILVVTQFNLRVEIIDGSLTSTFNFNY